MRPIEATFLIEKGMADPTPLLIIGFTDSGEAIVIDADGNIYTTDQDLVTLFASPDWPITFIDQFEYRRQQRQKEAVPG